MKKIMTYRDNFQNRADLFETLCFPYPGATKKTKAYIVELHSEYDNDFLYHLSCFDVLTDAIESLKTLSCGTFRLVSTERWKQ